MSTGWWIAIAAGAVWIGSLLLRRSAELPPGDDDGTLAQLVESGAKIEAIRRFRARHGGGLKDAREGVERLVAGGKAVFAEPPVPPPGAGEVEAWVKQGRPLEAIKAYREGHPGVDLATAKEAVDRLRERLGN